MTEATRLAEIQPSSDEQTVKLIHPGSFEDKFGDICVRRGGYTYFLGRGWKATAARCDSSQAPVDRIRELEAAQ